MEFKSCTMINDLYLNFNGRIDNGEKTIALCCETVADKPAVAFQETPEKTLECFLGMRSLVVAESLKNTTLDEKLARYTSGCQKCANYRMSEGNLSMLISYVNLSMYPAPCQCRCIYCSAHKTYSNTPEVQAAYEKLFATLELAKESGIVAPNALWQVSTGEITIHPYRERIIEMVRGQRAFFYTNCFLYDEDIAQNLHDNPASAINLSIDAGTPATWQKVKGFNNFEIVTSNLVRYYKQSARPGQQITLKYIVLPGVNDTYEDYTSLIEIMKVLEVKHLTISRDTNIKYHSNRQEQMTLCSAAAYLVALCAQNGITVDMTTYTPEERTTATKLAQEIIQKQLV